MIAHTKHMARGGRRDVHERAWVGAGVAAGRPRRPAPLAAASLAERSVLSTNGVVRGIRWGFGLGPA